MASQRIWAPWRLPYVKDASKDSESECIFCTKPAEEDDEANLIVHRGQLCFVILNIFPYTNGHLMIAPYAHLAALPDLAGDTNYMPVLADTRVMPQSLEESYAALKGRF